MFDFRVVTQWVDATLHQYLPASLVTTTEFVLVGVCLLVAYAVMALGLIYAERKVCAFFQCRLGPNRVGPFGMIQTVTDMIKMLIKEIIEINHVDRFLFNLAPYIVIIASLLAFSQRAGDYRFQCRDIFPDRSILHRYCRYFAGRLGQ